MVSLVDTDRLWFKAKVGLEATEASRESSFCSQAIRGNELFGVKDSRLDERFQDSPLVVNDPGIVFYAGAPIVSPEGHKVGTLCVLDNEPHNLGNKQRDMLTRLSRQVSYIFEQRIVAENLDRVNSQLAYSNEELSQFSYRASHDLKAPLVSIKRLSNFILKDLDEEQFDEVSKNVSKVSSLATRLEGVVTNVLALHQAGFEVQEGNNEESFSIRELIDGIKENLEWLLEDSDCDFVVDDPGELVVHSEKVCLQQILENLISNAAKYRDTSKDRCFVELKIRKNDRGVLIDVIDNGVGIPKKYHADVLKMFSRFHSDLSTGSGLGLAIVNKHIDALQGSIQFISTPGVGTAFSLAIPNIAEAN